MHLFVSERRPDFAANLRRLMARLGLTLSDVVDRTGLDERTIKRILRGGDHRPHPRTLHRLAVGLGVSADELFQNASLLAHRQFDRETNPAVEEALRSRPELFDGWEEADFDELYSRVGAGGALTVEGALESARRMNHKREVLAKVDLLLETGEAPLIAAMVDLLYARVVAT